MKISNIQIEQLVRKVLSALAEKKIIIYKASEDKVFKTAVQHVQKDFAREMELDREVNAMIDDLEKKNPGEFQRHKMFQLLKRKLAKDKGIVL